MLCFDAQPEVRAAAVYALSCLLDDPSNGSVGLPVSSSFSSSSTTSASFTPSLSPPPSPLLDDGADGGNGAAGGGRSCTC